MLEVGGGIGAIQLELLKAGAARTQNIELSSNYEPYAAELLQHAGLEGRVERRLMDFAGTVEPVDPADVVVLHKVVCCYHDYEALVGAAATHAIQQFVLTYPRRSWWTRLGFTTANLLERLRRKTFRAYVYLPAAIIAVARTHGLEPTTSHRGSAMGVLRPPTNRSLRRRNRLVPTMVSVGIKAVWRVRKRPLGGQNIKHCDL